MTLDRCDNRTLAAVYGDGAGLYSAIWSPAILPPARSLVSRLSLGKARCVLDVGAGTGALSGALRAAAPDACIVSIDPAWKMLRLAPVGGGTSAVLGDALALPFGDGSAQVVVLAYVLFHLLDPAAGVREAARVLGVGGQLGTVTWAQEHRSRAAEIWDLVMGEYGVPVLPSHSNHSGLDSVEAIDALFRASGLQPTAIWLETVEHTFEPDAFWRLRTGQGLNRARLSQLDQRERETVVAELRRRLDRLGGADHLFRGEVICAIGRR